MSSISKLVAMFIAAVALALPAVAQGSPRIKWSPNNDGWMRIEIRPNCYLVVFADSWVYGDMSAGIAPGEPVSVNATGACNERGFAEGPVTVEFIWNMRDPGGERSRYSWLRGRVYREGVAKNGLLEGLSSMWWQIEYDGWRGEWNDTDQGYNPIEHAYKRGCPFIYVDGQATDDALESPRKEWPQCSPEGAKVFYPEEEDPADEPPSADPIPPTARLIPATPAPATGADAWATCVQREKLAPDGGIQQLWRLHNTCPTAIIVRYCFRAQFEAAGDENLCRRREMRTHEINAGSYLSFAFNPMPAGTILSDGRTVTSNDLIVSGFACTGGNFPDAYFDSDGSFKSRGC